MCNFCRERENKLNFCSVEHYAEELKEHDILCSQFPDAADRGKHMTEQLKEERKASLAVGQRLTVEVFHKQS